MKKSKPKMNSIE
jgi:hypothetical protein